MPSDFDSRVAETKRAILAAVPATMGQLRRRFGRDDAVFGRAIFELFSGCELRWDMRPRTPRAVRFDR